MKNETEDRLVDLIYQLLGRIGADAEPEKVHMATLDDPPLAVAIGIGAPACQAVLSITAAAQTVEEAVPLPLPVGKPN